jgi:hypothetical protein
MGDMTTKERMLDVIGRLPDQTSIDEAIERLYLLKKIEIGSSQLDAGDEIPHEEIEREFCQDGD